MTAQTLQKLREKMGVSREVLARELGVHTRTVTRWEKGDMPIPKGRVLHLRLLAERKGAA